VRVSDKASVRVAAGDYMMARVGDLIDAEGWTEEPAGLVSTIVAEKVTITGLKPFVNAKRAKSLAASKANAERQQQRRTRSAKADSDEAEADDTEMAAASQPAAPAAGPVAARADRGNAAALRKPGDPPAEALILVDGFSVDQEKPAG